MPVPGGPTMLQGAKSLITGPTGQVAFPIARELAKANDVYAVARFGDPKRREMPEGLAIACMQKRLPGDELEDPPAVCPALRISALSP